LIALAGFLVGCATSQGLTEKDRSKIANISLDPNVARPKDMFFLDQGNALAFSLAAGGGAAGAAVGGVKGVAVGAGVGAAGESFQSPQSAGQLLLQNAERQGVLIEKITLEELASAIRSAGRIPIAEAASTGTAVLVLSIQQFGFSVPHSFSSDVVPLLSIKCELKDETGRVIWSASDRLLPLGNPVKPISIKDMYPNPKAMEDAWREAARAVARYVAQRL